MRASGVGNIRVRVPLSFAPNVVKPTTTPSVKQQNCISQVQEVFMTNNRVTIHKNNVKWSVFLYFPHICIVCVTWRLGSPMVCLYLVDVIWITNILLSPSCLLEVVVYWKINHIPQVANEKMSWLRCLSWASPLWPSSHVPLPIFPFLSFPLLGLTNIMPASLRHPLYCWAYIYLVHFLLLSVTYLVLAVILESY